jgi:hypothetical protein
VERVHKTVTVAGVNNIRLSLSLSNFKDSSVRKINIYASRPVSLFKLNDDAINYEIVPLSDVNLDGQLMYFQGSISPDDDTSFALDFGSTQAGERVMDVTPGCIERVGKAVSYNNRFHFFNSDVNHIKQIPTISNIDHSDSSSPWIPYAMFGDKWKIIKKTLSFSANSKLDIIYPLAEVKRMAFVKARWGSDGYLETPYEQMFYVDLKESSAYNYACAFDVEPSLISASSFYNQMRDEGQLYLDTTYKTVTLRRETNSVNVSAQYNPFVFPVKYSYAFGGEVLDIATSYLPISSTQIGQYPLSVFTSNGIYALEQGSGATLYGNIVPLQPHVIDGKAVATPYGTFFISSKSLYILVGREVTKVSDALEGTRELNIRDNEAYKKLFCNNRSPLYDFSRLLSSKGFDEFAEGAILTYDQMQNELYICSPSTTYYYSYVFNLNAKAFHKVSRKYIAANGCRYAVEVIGGGRNIVDLHTEDKIDNQTILLQSRPMPIETFFTHLQRLILLSDAKLTRNQNLCLTVFGSDNLDNWKCIISSQKADTTFRQIRTNKAAKSYRDYIIVISGTLDTSTDISDLIADYTVVTRRLG